MNNFSKELKNLKIFCINLKRRKDRKIKIKRIAKKKGLKINFFNAIDNKENPFLGVKQSHCQVIRNAIEKKLKYVMIIEDDIKFLQHKLNLDPLPEKWDLLYLGGEVMKIVFGQDPTKQKWVRCSTLNAHAYIINLKNKKLVEDILKCLDDPLEYDAYFCQNIHNPYTSYIHSPMMISQQNGYSDVFKKKMDYDLLEKSLDGFRKPESKINEEGNFVLSLEKLEEFPSVSIVTPTYKRRSLFPIAIRNFYNFSYPPDKLQWIIVEDSDEDSVEDLIPKDDKRIKFIKLDDWVPIGMKRNICVENADHKIIIHMDDDDYYPPESVYARVSLLKKYYDDGIRLVGCSSIGVYDLINESNNIAGDGVFSISEGTMGYYKSFWEQRKFDSKAKTGEYLDFIGNRFNAIMDVPYSFIMIAFKHSTNTVAKSTTQAIINKETGESHNFFDDWDEETQSFVKQLRNYFINKVKLEKPEFLE